MMMCVVAALQSVAAITITKDESVTIGSTTYSGYGIYGANEGEIALLLSGDNSVTVQWNGGSLDQLKSAQYVKIGSTSNPNVLNDADLAALENLSGAKFLDIDGSTLADGANIANITAGSAIEAVTLPNGLSKAEVNAAGASLTACNPSFGACLSLVAEMEEQEITQYWYDDPCSGNTRLEYTGTVNGNSGHVDNITRPLTFTGSSFTYINTKFKNGGEGEVTTCSENDIDSEGYIVPNPLKVEVTENDSPTRKYFYKLSDGTLIEIPSSKLYNVNMETGYVNGENWNMDQVDPRIPNPLPAGTQLEVQTEHNYTYTYTFMEGYNEVTKTLAGTPEGDAINGYYTMVANSYSPGNGYRFKVTSQYNYTYTNEHCNVTTKTYTDGPHETIDVPYNEDVTLTSTTKTINVPKEGGDCDVVAYVNTPGSLYKATSLDKNDVLAATGVVISGNINNGDISQGGDSGASSNDPQYNQGDADKFEPNNAVPAFAFNNTGAPIKSVDLSDVVLKNETDYKYLRVLNAYGANLESVVFPKTLTRIPNYCCYSGGNNGNYNLSEVVFPTASFTIGDYAFRHTPIKSLLIPGGVTDIGDHAFEACDYITDIEMEALSNTCHFGNYVFANCSALKHVTLSEKVENIGDYQFNQCGLLESIRIPSTCKTIGSYSFYECFSIHQMTIPEGVELIKINAFELAGITDLYIMANSIDKVPKIYAMSPTGAGPSTFSYQRTTGNNTAPQEHRSEMGEGSTVHYDEAMSWYQEEQSGPQGLGTGNCLTALHYPESMKPFYEAIDVTKFYTPEQLATIPLQTTQSGIQHYYTPDEYLALLPEGERRNYVQLELQNKKQDGTDPAYNFGVDEDGNPILYQYIPQAYAIDAFPTGHDNDRPIGPDADGRYYPNQHDYWIRMAAGATSTQAGGVGGEEVASAWGWRQFPLSSSVESIGETPFEKLYDDTWYTMAFPWRMIDNQLFSAFNQKCEIVEFVGAEVLDADDPSTDTKEYNLVFHFEDVADTYYMNDDDEEFARERDGDKVDAAGHRIWIYTSKKDGTVVKCPDEVLSSGYNPKSASPEVKEAYGRYLNIQNVMVLAGHPYMIHPSIGAAPGVPAKVYINGVKKIAVGEGEKYASYEDLAEANKVKKTVSSRTRIKTIDQNGIVEYTYDGPEAWTNPDTGASGGQYYFIGNINDAVETGGVSDNGAQDTPIPSYILAVPPGQKYPKYYRKSKEGTGKGKWSQYSAIIVPDGTANANVESLYLNKVTSPTGTGLAKGAFVELGEWDFNETVIIEENKISTIIDEALEKDPSTPIIRMNVVYNIKGQVVSNDSGSLEGLPKGIYIVNGKKYLVK